MMPAGASEATRTVYLRYRAVWGHAARIVRGHPRGGGLATGFAFAMTLQPSAAVYAAVPIPTAYPRISIASSSRRGRTDEGFRHVRRWLGRRLAGGVVARRRPRLLQTVAGRR